jgi:hypothetical protein
VAEARPLLVDLAFVVQVHVSIGARRCHLAIIDGDCLAAPGHVNHHESAAADVAGAWQGDRQRESHRHGRINSIAALLEDVDTDAGGRGLLGRDHAVTREDRMKDVPCRDDCGVLRQRVIECDEQQRDHACSAQRSVSAARYRLCDSKHVGSRVISVGPTRLA